MIRVVDVRRLRSPAARAAVCYCGRAWAGWPRSRWCNPFRADGLSEFCCHLALMKSRGGLPVYLADLWEASGRGEKPLGCWCGDSEVGDGSPLVCHAQILADLLAIRYFPNMDVAAQALMHLRSLRAAGVLLLPNGDGMKLSSAPAAVPTEQFRRCDKCGAAGVFTFTPSTALPCKCGGELLADKIGVADLRAERGRCAAALEKLAEACLANKGPDGKVTAEGAASHMRSLAVWMREGDS